MASEKAPCHICGKKLADIQRHIIRVHNTSKIVKIYKTQSTGIGKVYVMCNFQEGHKSCNAKIQETRFV